MLFLCVSCRMPEYMYICLLLLSVKHVFVSNNTVFGERQAPLLRGDNGCPLKIFGDFRDFYFLGQPIYWTHK